MREGIQGLQDIHQLLYGERESRPFLDEPDTSISILISTTVLHVDYCVMHSNTLPARPQPLVRSLQLVEV